MIRGLLRRPTPRHDDCGWNSPTHTEIALISELRNNSRVRVRVARLATALTTSSLLAVQTASTQDAKPIVIRLCRPATGQARNRGSPACRGYGPAKLIAASGRSEGCLEHSTRKSPTANKTAIAAQITTLLSSRSLFADSEAFNVESVVVT
jgi:hypothetical protein